MISKWGILVKLSSEIWLSTRPEGLKDIGDCASSFKELLMEKKLEREKENYEQVR